MSKQVEVQKTKAGAKTAQLQELEPVSLNEAQLQELRQVVRLNEGFLILCQTCFGLKVGSEAINAEARNATVAERGEVSKAKKGMNIISFIENSDLKGYKAKMQEIADANAVLKKAREPFTAEQKPLNKAFKWAMRIAIPDSLSELGKPVSELRTVPNALAKEMEEHEKEEKMSKRIRG